jgi:hypothetical protein
MDADHSDSDLLHTAIDATLTELIDRLPIRPPWYDRWRSLGHDPSEEDRLEVYQEIRNSQILPDDAGFYLIAWQVDSIASAHAETDLRHLDERLEAIEAAHPLVDEEAWESGEASAEHELVLEEYHQAWAAIFIAQLEEHGEPAIAELFQSDPEEFERRNESGRQFFHGPRQSIDSGEPLWLDSLVNAVGESLAPDSLMGPLGILYRVEDGFWEVDIFPTPVELVGGAEDGAVVSPAYSLDLEHLRSVIGRVEDFGWNALGRAEGGGPFVWIEGNYQGHALLLRVLAQAPEGEEPGAKLRFPGKNQT